MVYQNWERMGSMKTQIHLKSQWFWFVMTSLTHSVAQLSMWRSGPICCLFLHIASHRSSNSNQYTVNAKVLMALFVSLVLEVWEGGSDLLLFSPRESITFKFVNVFSPRKRTSHICTRWLTTGPCDDSLPWSRLTTTVSYANVWMCLSLDCLRQSLV